MPQPINPPIVASSTFRFEDTAETLRALDGEGHLYSRWDNPTTEAAEARLAELCGATRALCFGSGMAAITTTLLCALEERPRLFCLECSPRDPVEANRAYRDRNRDAINARRKARDTAKRDEATARSDAAIAEPMSAGAADMLARVRAFRR